MTTKVIIDLDICADCANCSLLEPSGPPPWDKPAICIAGWPRTGLYMNVWSLCKRFEKKKLQHELPIVCIAAAGVI